MGLSDEARKALNSAFDALSTWRNDLASATERNSSAVFDKMGAAAKALGWPADFVDMTRDQMQQASRLQLQMMDQVMDIWEQQMKAPGSAINMPNMFKGGANPFAPSSWPGAGAMPSMPGFDMSNMPANPMQFWMQAASMWQDSCQKALASWMEMQQNVMDQATRGSDDRR